MIRHSPGQIMAKLTAAATWQREATHPRMMLAWGRALFTEVDRVWAQLETAESPAYEDKVAAQVHVLEDATASLGLLSDTLERSSCWLKQQLQSLRT